MSDAVLAAIIAATATLCASFMQLRMALAREADARSRGQPISRRRGRLPMILIGIMLLASAVGGFALSQWLGDSQRTAQADLQRDLRERVADLSAAVAALERLGAASAVAATNPGTTAALTPPEPQPAADSPAAAPLTAATTAMESGTAPAVVAAPLPDARPMVAQGPAPTHTP
jgi:hypothetical protein